MILKTQIVFYVVYKKAFIRAKVSYLRGVRNTASVSQNKNNKQNGFYA